MDDIYILLFGYCSFIITVMGALMIKCFSCLRNKKLVVTGWTDFSERYRQFEEEVAT